MLHTDDGEIAALRTLVDDGGSRLRVLCARIRAGGIDTLRLAQVHPEEIAADMLTTLGFRPAGAHRAYGITLGAA